MIIKGVLMLKYIIFCLCFAFFVSAQAEVVNYVTPAQQNLGTISGPNVQNIVVEDDFFADLDLTAAKHGDIHAMGTLANSCLQKKDYSCAYKWSGIALRGTYWQQIGQEDKIKEIQNMAATHLSSKEISNIDILIKEFRPQ